MPIKKCKGCGLHYEMPSRAERCESCRNRHKRAVRNAPAEIKKAAARLLTKKAIGEGLIKCSPCEICGDTRSQVHHVDYDDPMNIKWLCAKHHQRLHHRQRWLGRLADHGYSADEIKKFAARADAFDAKREAARPAQT